MDEFMCRVCRNHNKPFQNSTANSMFARLGTDYEIQGISGFAILEAMTTDWDLSQRWVMTAFSRRSV